MPLIKEETDLFKELFFNKPVDPGEDYLLNSKFLSDFTGPKMVLESVKWLQKNSDPRGKIKYNYNRYESPKTTIKCIPEISRLKAPFAKVLNTRVSVRSFKKTLLSFEDVSNLLFYSYGELSSGRRPVASGGGFYPLDLYIYAHKVVGLSPGFYHYDVKLNTLGLVAEIPPEKMSLQFWGPMNTRAGSELPPLTVFVTFRPESSLEKYTRRAVRLGLLEAGMVLHQMTLVGLAMNLGSTNLGLGIFEDVLAKWLKIDLRREHLLGCIVFGKRKLQV